MIERLRQGLAQFTEATINGQGPLVDTVRPEIPPSRRSKDPKVEELFAKQSPVGVRKPSDPQCQQFENPDFPNVVQPKYEINQAEEQVHTNIGQEFDLGTCDLQQTPTPFDTAPANSYQAKGRRGGFGASGSLSA